MRQHGAKRDENEREIITALENSGLTVHQLSGPGVPDLLVGRRGGNRNYLLEVKVKGGKLTDKQEVWHQRWRGQVNVVTTPNEALLACGVFVYPVGKREV